MSDNEPGFDSAAIAPPSPDVSRTPPTAGESPAPPQWQPELNLPERALTQKPRWPHPNFGFALLWCVLFLLVTQLPGSVIAAVIAVALTMLMPDRFPIADPANPKGLLQSEAMSVGLAIGIFIIQLTVIAFSLLVIRLVVGRDWTRQLAVRRPSLAHGMLALASLPAFILLGNVAYNLLRSVLHLPSFSDTGLGGMEEVIKLTGKWPWPFAVLAIGLGPGIGEELWCRGFLGRGLLANYGVVLGIVATSFLFGLIHLDPCQGTMAMVMGLWLHFVYLTSRSLWLPILLHFCNNAFGVLAPRFALLEPLDAPPNVIPVLVYVSALLLIVAVTYALYRSRARLETVMPDQLALWRPAYAGVAYPPEGSGMRVVHRGTPMLAAALAAGSFLLFVLACAAWLAA